MDMLTLAQFSPERCPWPCKLTITTDVIIIVAGVIYLVERLKAYLSNK